MKFNPLPDRTYIMEWLHYSPETGDFTWMKEPSIIDGRNKFKTAGTNRRTAIYIGLPNFGLVAAHRLAWIYVHGSIPDGMEIDHKDCDPTNNRLDNLRLATSSQQKQNKRVQSNNRAGLKGAYYHACRTGKKWRSQIKVGQRLIFLGYFHTAEEAHEAYALAAAKHFGEFARVA